MSLRHFFNDAIIIYNESSRDEYGREAWGSGIAVSGRFIETSKVIYNTKGETQTADALIHLPAGTDISVGSKVVFDGASYRAISLVKPKDMTSIRFIKVYLEETL